ncbi:hypothetical protein H6G89_14015 [Oscillatoria sp. FACHB-1407]|uniref:hypothetical protein n=1 Tax=Oscillatoria sp. FACHB-1407 TaxID=2692847 RepID=UPI00168887D9|nr:hypothetical protein [Oscillatoria sp. FACHB-1407]MBD2462163.1 hypothetical protein [Oscillatoria sp. FACHB-1407]
MDDLTDFLQKTMYLGVGLAAYAFEKIEHLDESLAELHRQTQRTVEELIDKGEQVVAQNNQTNSASTNWQVRPLHRRLLELVNGNEELANRLVERTRMSNPDQTLIWVYEKVIYDLERDRT